MAAPSRFLAALWRMYGAMHNLQCCHATIALPLALGRDYLGVTKVERTKRTSKKMNLMRTYRNWRRYRQTVNELTRLSNRELSDLGIARSDIPYLARKSV